MLGRRSGDGRLAAAMATAAVVSVVPITGCQGNSPSPRRDATAAVVPSAAPGVHPEQVGPSVVGTREVKGFSRLLT